MSQPIALRTAAWDDYGLIDSGDGRKLERFGPYRVVRPEPQCLWTPRLDAETWQSADAVFDPAGDEDEGRWRVAGPPLAAFSLAWRGVRFAGRFTPFRHLGFFPEQAANWAWLDDRVRRAARPLKILNLFGYTGVASLVCAAAGALVVPPGGTPAFLAPLPIALLGRPELTELLDRLGLRTLGEFAALPARHAATGSDAPAARTRRHEP